MTLPHTIESMQEALLNPDGRFGTLRRVIPLSDSSGMPAMRCTGTAVQFEVIADGGRRLLVMAAGDGVPAPHICARRAAETLSLAPWLVPCRFLPQEVLLFDSSGRASRADIFLEDIPSGAMRIDDFLRLSLGPSARPRLHTLLEGLVALYGFLSGLGAVHGTIDGNSLYVTADGTPRLAGYPYSPTDNRHSDARALLRTALSAFIALCEPSRWPDLRRELRRDDTLDEMTLQAEFDGDTSLAQTLRILRGTGNPDDGTVVRLLEGIARDTCRPLPLLAALRGIRSEEAPTVRPTRATAPAQLPRAGRTVDFRSCSFVGKPCDTVVRYRQGEAWGFADIAGNIIADRLDGADDFYEGRAAALSSTGWGLLDRGGQWRIAPVHEALRWHGPENVAAVADGGRWMLLDRCGEQLSDAAYDAIGEPSEGLFPVRRGGRCGFIDAAGHPVTELRFDETGPFRDGSAEVRRGSRTYRIGHDGRMKK